MRRLAGYDLNGWHDRMARNWNVTPEGEIEQDVHMIGDAGRLSSIVGVGKNGQEWIGGLPARLAPHGRGAGWGAIGVAGRRHTVRDLLQDPSIPAELLGRAFAGLGGRPTHAVVAIDDIPATNDSFRERMLKALRGEKLGKPLLVWRSVLTAISVVQQQPELLKDQDLLCVVSHHADGLSVQTLRLRRAPEDGALVWERRRTGELVRSPLGYLGLLKQAEVQIEIALHGRSPELFEKSQAASDLAFGARTKTELLRKNIGAEWLRHDPPHELDHSSISADLSGLRELCGNNPIIFETMCEGSVQLALRHTIESALGREIMIAHGPAVATGALWAAQRFANNMPVHFDFLPQVSTIVADGWEAQNFDLVQSNETLPAGKLYRSSKPAELGLNQGESRISLYLRHEGDTTPRRSEIVFERPMQNATRVQLTLEQVPAAGRARIHLHAPDAGWSRLVEWDEATPISLSWEAQIEELTNAPVIPERMILPCDSQFWIGNRIALNQTLREAQDLPINWQVLAAKIGARFVGHYPVSSDGVLPDGADADALDKLTDIAKREFLNAYDGGQEEFDTNIAKFLTWQFQRCPLEVANAFLNIARHDDPKNLFPGGSQKLLWQGLGRVVKTEHLELLTLDVLRNVSDESWRWDKHSACAAFVLSRSDTAGRYLTDTDVKRLALRAHHDFTQELNTSYNRLHYAPALIGGLLKRRGYIANTLVVGVDPMADLLVKTIDDTLQDLKVPRNGDPRFAAKAVQYAALLNDLREAIHGTGSAEGLLTRLFQGFRGNDRAQ